MLDGVLSNTAIDNTPIPENVHVVNEGDEVEVDTNYVVNVDICDDDVKVNILKKIRRMTSSVWSHYKMSHLHNDGKQKYKYKI